MARRINHYVFGFDVAEDDVVLVQVADRLQDLWDVEHRDIVREPAAFSQSAEELAARDVLEKHVDAFRVVECGFAE